MDMNFEALKGKATRIKIAYNAAYFNSLLQKHGDRNPELFWEEVCSNIEFSYLSVTTGADNTSTIVLRAEIPGEPELETAPGTTKIYFQ